MRRKKNKRLLSLIVVFIMMFVLVLPGFSSVYAENTFEPETEEASLDEQLESKVENEGENFNKRAPVNENLEPPKTKGAPKQNKYVEVPAIWYAVDEDTGELITELNPINTVPDMYPRREMTVLNEETGNYDINLAAIPEPDPYYTENNFNLTASILFTDRFHRVMGQGYNTFKIKPVSSVVKVEYGDVIFDDLDNGIQGVTRTPYQDGETMHMYLCTRYNATLSEATYKEGEVTVTSKLTDAEARQALLDHVEGVNYVDLDALQVKSFDLTTLDKIFLFRYTSGDEGEFIKDGEEYKNFMNSSFADLPDGRYEAVFPIYWQKDIPDAFGAAGEYIRNRYKLDDTFHFSFTKKNVVDVNVRKIWNDGDNIDGSRPESITIKLLVDGVANGKTLILTEANNWIGTFLDLDEYKDGKRIVYGIEEVLIEDYTAEVSGNAQQGFVLTNYYEDEDEDEDTITPTDTTKPTDSSTYSDAGPKTGEGFELYFWSSLAILTLAGAMIIFRRKNERLE